MGKNDQGKVIESRDTRHLIVKVLKIVGISLCGIVLLLCVLLFCAVKFIESKELSPFAERVANEYVNGQVKVGSLRIGFHPRFPILGVVADNLSVISAALDSLPAEERGRLPNYADSLLMLDHVAGSLDIKRLLMDNDIVLTDVELRGLSVNLVIARDGKANYEIVKTPSASSGERKGKVPGFRINRFTLSQPKEIRFYNAADSTSASVLLLTDAMVESDKEPAYRLKISGNVTSPKATLVTNLDKITFGLDGKVYWDQKHPGLVAMEEMVIRGAFIKAIVTGEIDLTDHPIVRKAVVELSPVALADLLTLVPDSIRRLHRLKEPYFSSDVSIGGRFELTKPMDLTTDTFPSARLDLNIPPSSLHYDRLRFGSLAIDVAVNTLTNCPDSTVIELTRCLLEGESATLNASAIVSRLLSDPKFDATVKGEIDLTNLPPFVVDKIPGYLSGIISTDLHAAGTSSMLKPEHIDRLLADGYVVGSDLYFLSSDTSKMVEVGKARIDFRSGKIVDNIPRLTTKIDIDTANILIGGVDIAAGTLSLDAGFEKDVRGKAASSMMPIVGTLNTQCLNIISITDSAGGRIHDLEGHITLRELSSRDRLPEIIADLHTGHVSAGSLSDRILLDGAKIRASLLKLAMKAEKGSGAGHRVIRSRVAGYMPPGEVFRYAYDKRHRKPGQKRTRRVYGTIGTDDNEILEWNLAKGFNKFLNEWQLNGSVTSLHARLLTPMFPLHNRFSHLDLRFNNDTVNISDIALEAGKSDIALSGLVTNVRRALTAKSDNTLKMNLHLHSDTVDINELAAGVMTGNSYTRMRRQGNGKIKGTSDDAELEARLGMLAKQGAPPSPFLIPVNIDANLRLDATQVLYGDFTMQNMGGDLLVYDGGVNLHDMKAASDAGNLLLSVLYSAPNTENMQFGFGMKLEDFNIGKFVKLVPVVDSIVPLLHDFSGTVGADIAATCRIDSGMNLRLPTLNAAIRITGDNLAFINPRTYRTLGKWLGFKDKSDNTIKRMNVEMTVADGLMRVYPFTFNIDRYRLGISGFNDIAMNFDYHISILKSPLPFKFGINISGNPKKYKVRFGGAKFNENTAVESVNVVNEARINLIDQIENVFKRGVRNSRFAKVDVDGIGDGSVIVDPGLTAADSLRLIREGIIAAPGHPDAPGSRKKNKKIKEDKKDKTKRRHKRFFIF